MVNSLTEKRLKELLHYDAKTGIFTHRANRRGVNSESVVGSIDYEGYRRVRLDRVLYGAHRLAWLYVHGIWPTAVIDHINGDRQDNSLANLRDVSRAVNCQNLRKSMPKRLKPAPLGVSWQTRAGKWRAMIWDGVKNKYLGLFVDADDAHKAYLKAKRLIHPGCTI